MSAAAELRPPGTLALVRVGATAAIAGGALRIVSTFVPYDAEQPWLEAVYGAIDLCLLFGLLAVYLVCAEAVGVAGLVLFIVAMAGLASIVGPDAQAFGVDFYRLGALVFVAGLAGFSVQLLRRRALASSALMWLATLVCSLASTALPVMFMAAGVLLGAGYVAAGVSILRRGSAPAGPSGRQVTERG